MRHEIQGIFTHLVRIFTIGQCQAYIQTSQGFYISIKYFIITSVPQYQTDIKHKTISPCQNMTYSQTLLCHQIFPFNCPWCPDTSLEHDILTVLFAETCFYGGGDCGESNTGHRQRGNQPHGTHIPVFQLTRQLYRR